MLCVRSREARDLLKEGTEKSIVEAEHHRRCTTRPASLHRFPLYCTEPAFQRREAGRLTGFSFSLQFMLMILFLRRHLFRCNSVFFSSSFSSCFFVLILFHHERHISHLWWRSSSRNQLCGIFYVNAGGHSSCILHSHGHSIN